MTKIVIITGPTATGKSEIAIQIAKSIKGCIINADSIQIYKEIPILSAQPKKHELEDTPHRMYGFLSNEQAIKKRFCIGTWLDLVVQEINKAIQDDLIPIIVGGTGMYISALVNGFCDIPDVDQAIEKEVITEYKQTYHENFLQKVQSLDPETPTDPQRLIRNYCLIRQFGKTLKWFKMQGNKRFFEPDVFIKNILLPPREEIYKTCNSRFIDMLNDGAIEEVANLQKSAHIANGILKATGMREILGYLSGEISKENMIKISQQSTRNYAKRQTTWMRNQFKDFNFHSTKSALKNSIIGSSFSI